MFLISLIIGKSVIAVNDMHVPRIMKITNFISINGIEVIFNVEYNKECLKSVVVDVKF